MNVKTTITPVIVASAAALAVLSGGCSKGNTTESPRHSTEIPEANVSSVESPGHSLYIAKGCAACHGQDAEGSSIAPALPGHNEEMVKNQVRNPRFQMPAFGPAQISNEELDSIARFIAALEGDDHLHHETADLSAAVEMHHWMALESLEAHDLIEAGHHVGHIIELLEPGDHQNQMHEVLASLDSGGDSHEPEHRIEEMLSGSASPGLTVFQLHLEQALDALDAGDLSDAKHHVAHAREAGDDSTAVSLAEVLKLLEVENSHGAEHEIQELLGAKDHID